MTHDGDHSNRGGRPFRVRPCCLQRHCSNCYLGLPEGRKRAALQLTAEDDKILHGHVVHGHMV